MVPASLVNKKTGNPYRRERLDTVDLLVQISLNQLLLIMQTLFAYLQKQAILMGRSTVLQLVFPAKDNEWVMP